MIPNTRTNRAVATFIQSLAPLNSAANPLIYCLFSTNIGQQLCNLFGCRKAPANLSTGMTTSTHSTKPSNSTISNYSCNSTGGGRRAVSSTMSVPVRQNNNGIIKPSVRATLSSGPVSARNGTGSLLNKQNTVLEEPLLTSEKPSTELNSGKA